MTAYYNEVDPFAAQWLRNLIAAGHIASGDVDERSIEDVRPVELIGYDQCHFFAGIGVWSYALRRAGWPDDRPVWTGSCPCQPFSAAGKRGGTADERHLWPHWFHLIQTAKPREVPVFGEQVASKDGLAWLDLVHADLEGAGYAVGAVDLCAAGVGAPHIRQRLFFVADADGRHPGAEGLQRGREHGQQPQDGGSDWTAKQRCVYDAIADQRPEWVGDSDHARSQGRGLPRADRERDGARQRATREAGIADGGTVEYTAGIGREVEVQHSASRASSEGEWEANVRRSRGATNGFWRDADWLPCIDGKARPVEPGTFPLAHGVAGRMGRLRAYGNAIVAPVAEEFIRAYLK